LNNYDSDKSGRKAESISNGRKFSESDSSSLRRRSARSGVLLRSISHQTTSSSCSSENGEEDIEVKNLLLKTNDRLEHTRALRIHSHLLRPEDYVSLNLFHLPGSNTEVNVLYRLQKEIISTCQNNIHCLEAILTGPPGTVLSDSQCHTIKGKRKKNDKIEKYQCRCARITRFIASMIDYLLDYVNLFRNFILYKFLMDTICGFYRMIGSFGSGVMENLKKLKFLL
jgi:hypothetical protein